MEASIRREKGSLQDGIWSRSVWLAAAVVVVFSILLVAWVILQPGSPRVSRIVGSSGDISGPLFALFLCFLGFRAASRTDEGPTGWQWPPLMLGAGILSYTIGRVVFHYYVWVLDRLPPMPSYATIGFLGQYPLLLAGILLLLPARTGSGASRTRVALEGLMIMTTVVTFSWYFFLGPVIHRGSETALAKTFATAYPLADIVLIASLLILVVRAGGRAFGGAVPLLTLGMVLIVITDGAYGYERINHLYRTGTLLDAGWPIGYMLVGLAAYLVGLSSAASCRNPPRRLSLALLWRKRPGERGLRWGDAAGRPDPCAAGAYHHREHAPLREAAGHARADGNPERRAGPFAIRTAPAEGVLRGAGGQQPHRHNHHGRR